MENGLVLAKFDALEQVLSAREQSAWVLLSVRCGPFGRGRARFRKIAERQVYWADW
jgi:hypothetical protein